MEIPEVDRCGYGGTWVFQFGREERVDKISV